MNDFIGGRKYYHYRRIGKDKMVDFYIGDYDMSLLNQEEFAKSYKQVQLEYTFEPNADRLFVSLMIQGDNINYYTNKALVDTGSLFTTVKESVAMEYMIDTGKTRCISVANGETITCKVYSGKFSFYCDKRGGFPTFDVEVMALPDDEDCDAIIGMDILKQASSIIVSNGTDKTVMKIDFGGRD